jgi:multisubunit Na+/H+ antiporter MnhE subunit
MADKLVEAIRFIYWAFHGSLSLHYIYMGAIISTLLLLALENGQTGGFMRKVKSNLIYHVYSIFLLL